MDERPSYFSILPAKVRYDNEISMSEKVMFSEISALSNKYGYCHAGNNYFAELYQKSKSTISIWINDLRKRGHLLVEYEHDGDNPKQITGRKIYPLMDAHSLQKPNTPLEKSKEGYLEKSKDPISKNLKDNTTSINNTSINNNDDDDARARGNENQPNTPNVFDTYQQAFNRPPNAFIIDDLMERRKHFDEDVIIEAIRRTGKNNASWNYANTIMNRWEKAGVKTMQDVEQQDAEYKKSHEQPSSRKKSSEKRKKQHYGMGDYTEAKRRVDNGQLPF